MDILNNVVSSGIIGGLVYFLLKVYVGKKLENVATEEDIGGITKAVESIKTDFQKDIEKLKQELAVLTHKHTLLFQEEKQAIVDYLSAWNIWFGSLNSEDDFHKLTDIEVVRDIIKRYNKNYDNAQIAMSKLELFLDNDEVIESAEKLNSETLDLHKLMTIIIQSLNRYHDEMKLFKNDSAKAKDANERMSNTVSEYRKQIKNTAQKAYMITREEFISISKKYIRKDI